MICSRDWAAAAAYLGILKSASSSGTLNSMLEANLGHLLAVHDWVITKGIIRPSMLR